MDFMIHQFIHASFLNNTINVTRSSGDMQDFNYFVCINPTLSYFFFLLDAPEYTSYRRTDVATSVTL